MKKQRRGARPELFVILLILCASVFSARELPPEILREDAGAESVSAENRKPSWALREDSYAVIDAPLIIVAALIVFCALGFTVCAAGIVHVLRDSAAIRLEAAALLTGDSMPSEKEKGIVRIRKRGIGLRLKVESFALALVLLVVIMVSAPLYLVMTRSREETLLEGLWDRSAILLEGVASGARAYMPGKNFLELGYLPHQSMVLPEAGYITITGYGSGNDIYNDHVLATNDPAIQSKIDTTGLEIGVSRLTDSLSRRAGAITAELNVLGRARAGALFSSLNSLLDERRNLPESARENAAGREQLEMLSLTIHSLEELIDRRLIEIGRETGSEPPFSVKSLAANSGRTFIFFKPILYRQNGDDLCFRGLVRLEIDLASIVDEVARARIHLLQIILIVALAALALGTAGALTLSTLLLRPIIRLVSHVERIRDTEDKSKLAGVDIVIKSRDELAVLGDTINDMTHRLVKAAAATSDLSIGKEIQKKFLPLDINREGDKLTCGYKDTKNTEFFGYYEGAKGVSGDYFDYQDLDGRYFAIIKCDVAGKGIPAALIMIQVATMFINYFKDWKPTEEGMRIEKLVYQINDFIETLAFKGRFAAFTLCILDSETGMVRFCNAGDNIVHWYDASEKQLKTTTLKETPAAGVLPNALVESRSGYTVQNFFLDRGDALFLYTDGIEEAKRKFRDSAFREIVCEEGESGALHETHTVGQDAEELGSNRVFDLVNAVMNRRLYTLRKFHNPEGEADRLGFDFSSCEGGIEDAIMAMVSVEKIFRIYKNPAANEENRVLVDKKIDEFLKRHFLQYRDYCRATRKNPGNKAYLWYTRIEEDEQYDDLTILGIRRK
jgi:serine phosphatase RsbU (regulator of sigma subunit)